MGKIINDDYTKKYYKQNTCNWFITPCFNGKVGSKKCKNCEYFISKNTEEKYVLCKFKPTQDNQHGKNY